MGHIEAYPRCGRVSHGSALKTPVMNPAGILFKLKPFIEKNNDNVDVHFRFDASCCGGHFPSP